MHKHYIFMYIGSNFEHVNAGTFKRRLHWTGAMPQRLRTLFTLEEDPSSIPSTHRATQSYL